MEAKIITIGNSRGVRLPKKILEAAKLESAETVKLTITAKGLLLTPRRRTREGWASAAKGAVSEDLWGGAPPWNRFDETEWVW